MLTPEQLQSRLAEPLPPERVHWKAQVVKGDKALAVAYLDARDVMDRLDEVVGVGNWADAYDQMPGVRAVRCRLSVRVGGEWVTKEDVGGESGQPDEDDRIKAAYSDALKRAAVKFGLGRFIYRLRQQWVGYDPQRKRLTEQPRLEFLPAHRPPPRREPAREADGTPATPGGDGPSVRQRVERADAAFAARGWCPAGELAAYVLLELGTWEAAEADPLRAEALVKGMGAELRESHGGGVAAAGGAA